MSFEINAVRAFILKLFETVSCTLRQISRHSHQKQLNFMRRSFDRVVVVCFLVLFGWIGWMIFLVYSIFQTRRAKIHKSQRFWLDIFNSKQMKKYHVDTLLPLLSSLMPLVPLVLTAPLFVVVIVAFAIEHIECMANWNHLKDNNTQKCSAWCQYNQLAARQASIRG